MKGRARHAKERVARLDIKLDDLKAIVERAKASLSDEDHAALAAAVDTLAFVTQELAEKGASLERLRRLLFGEKSEASKIFGKEPTAGSGAAGADDRNAAGARTKDSGEMGDRPKPPGHGRNGAAAYRGATRVKVPHPELARGAGCPGCKKGKVYPLAAPAVLVRIAGMAPLGATVYECEQLRCNHGYRVDAQDPHI